MSYRTIRQFTLLTVRFHTCQFEGFSFWFLLVYDPCFFFFSFLFFKQDYSCNMNFLVCLIFVIFDTSDKIGCFSSTMESQQYSMVPHPFFFFFFKHSLCKMYNLALPGSLIFTSPLPLASSLTKTSSICLEKAHPFGDLFHCFPSFSFSYSILCCLESIGCLEIFKLAL